MPFKKDGAGWKSSSMHYLPLIEKKKEATGDINLA
jgi:hypothetical protein